MPTPTDRNPTGPSDTDRSRPVGEEPATAVVPDRRCGRCQRAFPGDPTLFFQTDWALCPECEPVLL